MTAREAKTKSARPSLQVDPETSARLGRIRQKDTAAEQAVRRAIHALGLRFRVSNRDLPGAPDVANRARRWAVFVHGCFWHAHEGCPRATVPKRNREFWEAKFAANRARDARAVQSLGGLRYRVVVVWECEIVDSEALGRRLAPLVAQA